MTLGLSEILIGSGVLVGAWALYMNPKTEEKKKPSTKHDPIECSRYLISQLKADPDTKAEADKIASILGPVLLKLDGV